jgi:hypothetical protein
MDFDFLDKNFFDLSREAVVAFRNAVEESRPPDDDLKRLCARIQPYEHCKVLDEDFIVGAVDGSGEFPLLQQDDVFVHFSVSAGSCFRTETARQYKLVTTGLPNGIFRSFVVMKDSKKFLIEAYANYLYELLGRTLEDLVRLSDYCDAYSAFGKKLRPKDVSWDAMALSSATQIATHAYQLRTLAELGMAVRVLAKQPKYVLLDTSMVYFLLGESPYLPELLKRYIVCRARECNAGILALSKSHNIPNGDLIGRCAKDELGIKDHWFIRLPSQHLGEESLSFLRGKEIPPKLCVSYLFKFHATSFPMRIDVDVEWWKKNINHDLDAERRMFAELDYTCHDIRSYGYPYPLHAAHRSASLTKQEKKAVRDIMLQNAQSEGVIRGAFLRDPESVHMGGI